MFRRLVLYIEACESGSMCERLYEPTTKTYCFTASGPYGPSYACDFNKTIGTYLNDCWSIAWMQDTRTHDTGGWSLGQQAEAVKHTSKRSISCQYGDLSFLSSPISDFLGKKAGAMAVERPMPTDATPTHMVHLRTLEMQMAASSEADRPALETEYRHELFLKSRAESVFRHLKTVFKEGAQFS